MFQLLDIRARFCLQWFHPRCRSRQLQAMVPLCQKITPPRNRFNYVLPMSSQLTGLGDGGVLGVGDLARLAAGCLDGLDDLQRLTIRDFAKDHVLAVQPIGDNGGDEELRSVADESRASQQGPGEKGGSAHVFGPALAMDKRPGIVCFLRKFSSANFSPYIDLPPVPCCGADRSAVFRFLYDGGSTATHVATGEVTALKHELRDHTMELRTSVAKALLASAKGTEVFSGLGSDIVVEVEIDPAGLVCDGN